MKWLFLWLSSFVMQFVGLFVVTAVAGLEQFPRWAWPWRNDDDTEDGDPSHRERWKGKSRYWQRWAWCAWRNRAHNYSHWLGVPQDSECTFKMVGVEPNDYYGRTGVMYAIAERRGKLYWGYYRIRKWPFIPYGFATITGWKLRELKADDPRIQNGKVYTAAIVGSIRPFKRLR